MDETEEIRKEYRTLKAEVDALQVSVMGSRTPWYRNIPVIISMLALMFSFGTTYVSNKRIRAQDVQALKSDLRNMLQQLAGLPIKNFELTKKYADDPNAISFMGGQLNQENVLLSSQAAELIRKLPADKVSAIEAYSVAVALQFSYQNQKAREMYQLSYELAGDMATAVAAKRGMANILFIGGQPETGRVQFQEALNIFSAYKGYNEFTVKSTHIITLLNWFGAEAGAGFHGQAAQRLKEAEDIAESLPPGPFTNQLKGQILQARNQAVGMTNQPHQK